MKWNNFEHEGVVYTLDHLYPFEWVYVAPESASKSALTYRFHVSFSSHCFTRSPLAAEVPDINLWYRCPEHERRPRLFCFDRHKYSLLLPDIVRSLGDRQLWHSNHNSFFTIEVVGATGAAVEYEVYFDVTRATRRGWLNLVIQSAYVRTEDYQTNQPGKRKIRLAVIAYKRMRGEKILPGR